METIDIDGTQRFYALVRHRMDEAAGPVPVFVNLHGLGGYVFEQRPALDIGFEKLATLGPALIVHPQGAGRQWDLYPASFKEGRRPGGTNGKSVDDIAFLRALIAHLIATAKGDKDRVYVIGISNGGYMTARIACEMGDVVAAVADLIATALTAQLQACSPPRPAALLLLMSTTDPVNPYAGETRNNDTGLASAVDTVTHFARLHNCRTRTETPLPDLDPNDQSTVSLIRHSDCTDGASVEFYRVDGAGHNLPKRELVPGANPNARRNRDIETAEVVAEFLLKHRLVK